MCSFARKCAKNIDGALFLIEEHFLCVMSWSYLLSVFRLLYFATIILFYPSLIYSLFLSLLFSWSHPNNCASFPQPQLYWTCALQKNTTKTPPDLVVHTWFRKQVVLWTQHQPSVNHNYCSPTSWYDYYYYVTHLVCVRYITYSRPHKNKYLVFMKQTPLHLETEYLFHPSII